MPDVPTAGSLLLFLTGALLYEISVTALGILIATFTISMAQFGLLCIPILVILQLLSGSSTLMQIASTTHFVSFCQAVLYRGAGLEIVWPQLLMLVIIGGVCFAVARLRFRRTLVASR